MRNFRNWNIYISAKSLTKKLYHLSTKFPPSEQYGLTSQIRRASVSIVANIAEGAGRSTDKDFAYFLAISLGSSFEIEALIDLSVDLEFVEESEHIELIQQLHALQKQLNAFIGKLKN